jgi:hypothetical protein
MKLTQDNIKFIDTYLENSDVKYIDIRLEMVDHVATAIEAEMTAGDTRDFYYIFKDYMVANKRRLLDNNDEFLKQTTKKLSDKLVKAYFSFQALLIAVFITILIYFGIENFGFDHATNVTFIITLILIMVPAIGYLIALKVFDYQRFSGVERLSFYLVFLIQFVNFTNVLNTSLVKGIGVLGVSIITALIFTFLLVFVKVSVVVFRDYKNRYQTID